MADTPETNKLSSPERLAQVRQRIDEIDVKLLELLNERSNLSVEVGRIKAGERSNIFKPQREGSILDRLASLNRGPLPQKALRSIWREIFSCSRSLQRPLRVAYLGPEGTFSFFAGVEYLGHSATYHSCVNLPQVFEEVNGGTCDVGVVPLENSLQGTVGVSFDLFMKYPVVIQAELFSRISHSLLSIETSPSRVTRIYSHPQPLAQCSLWLRTHMPHAALIPLESTAAAAHKAQGEPGTAAIGNGNLADMLDMNVLARRIEDESYNWTRFVIIANAAATTSLGALPTFTQGRSADHCKTSVLFTLMDRPGALSEVLDLLAHNGINMRKLESRPLRGQCWKYVFFCDVEQDLLAPQFEGVVKDLTALCTTFRILGSYTMGPQLDRSGEADDLTGDTEEDKAAGKAC